MDSDPSYCTSRGLDSRATSNCSSCVLIVGASPRWFCGSIESTTASSESIGLGSLLGADRTGRCGGSSIPTENSDALAASRPSIQANAVVAKMEAQCWSTARRDDPSDDSWSGRLANRLVNCREHGRRAAYGRRGRGV